MLQWILKTRERRLVLVIVLALLVIGFVSLFDPLYGQLCQYNEYKDQETCRSGGLVIVLLLKAARFIDSFNGFVTAAATALLTWITWRLATLENEAAETTRAQLRAYIFIEKAS